jgi:hypothetical protein
MALADSTYVIRARSPVRRILGAILRSNVIQPILRVARNPLGTGARFPDKYGAGTRPCGSLPGCSWPVFDSREQRPETRI